MGKTQKQKEHLQRQLTEMMTAKFKRACRDRDISAIKRCIKNGADVESNLHHIDFDGDLIDLFAELKLLNLVPQDSLNFIMRTLIRKLEYKTIKNMIDTMDFDMDKWVVMITYTLRVWYGRNPVPFLALINKICALLCKKYGINILYRKNNSNTSISVCSTCNVKYVVKRYLKVMDTNVVEEIDRNYVVY